MKKVVITGLVLLGAWALGAALIYLCFSDWPTRGQFGDMFGAVNALFSSLALLGVVAAIWIQKEELELQRKELEMTRVELSRTAEAQESSSAALEQQLSHLATSSRLNGLSSLLSSIETEIEHYAADNRNRAATETGPFKYMGGRSYEDEKTLRELYRRRITALLVELGEQELDKTQDNVEQK